VELSNELHGAISLFEKLMVTQLVMKMPIFMKPECYLLCSWEPSVWLYS